MNSFFPERSIKEIAKVIVSSVDKKSVSCEVSVSLCNYSDVYYNNVITKDMVFMGATAKESEIGKFALMPNDVVITKDSESANDIGIPAFVESVPKNLICGYHLAILRPNKSIDAKFLSYALQLPKVARNFYRYSNGVTRFGLTEETYRKVTIPFPSYSEQKAIADLLSTWDEAIEKTERLIELKEKQQSFWMTRLLKKQIRLKGFNQAWTACSLGELFTERKEKDFSNLPLLSITKTQGVIPQNLNGKRDTSCEDKSCYLRICKGDIGYNTMRMWQGVSALSNLEGIVSPAYTICVPKDNVDGVFMAYLFKLPRMIHLFYRYSQGLTSDTLNLKFHHFSKIKICIPSLKEQKAIASFLKVADNEKDLLERLKKLLIIQKKGLMQKLLTGKWRVNHKIVNQHMEV
ncbi:restriction endonuclease subunit S [Aminobacterium sp. MB27-C1]|uniref:restriction endonuclease subunit S n=1 Tax=Aminobacterium sp. MB27-C1 TaxID=3070661 RepID=UPI0027DD2A5B|nr:restriction endonuclease subunit S [Aminobacterium sp. MB27-C1]WMI72182.1 restriction endonuclease subunit S [Aminobacterium sp. MB27-C1]